MKLTLEGIQNRKEWEEKDARVAPAPRDPLKSRRRLWRA